MSVRYLVDTSAYARANVAAVRNVLAPMIEGGEMATCGIVSLELLYSARSAAHLAGLRQELALALESIAMQESDFERAADVLGALADRGQSRAARLPDLLLAAVAERAGLTILHYDEDFDRIAAVTDQAVQWVVPRGSI